MASTMREALVAPGMLETFLNRGEAAACGSCAKSVARGHSILTLSSLATKEEVAALKVEALAIARAHELDASSEESERERERRICELRAAYIKTGQQWRTRCAVPSGSDASRHRLQIQQNLAAPGQALCDSLLIRALSMVDDERLVNHLFGDCVASCPGTCVHNPKLSFSTNEPAINVYFPGGGFKAHEDHQALTVLVPLSAAAEFEGGGTAFWSAEDAGLGGSRNHLGKPTMVLRPPAGAALLWGGDVTHSGLPVLSGQRCIFVASFSAKNSTTMLPQQAATTTQSSPHGGTTLATQRHAPRASSAPGVPASYRASSATVSTSQKIIAEILRRRA